MITAPTQTLLWAINVLLVSLLVGTLTRWISLRHASPGLRHQRFASLRTWWILALLVGTAVLAGRLGVCLLFLTASIIALREYATLLGVAQTERPCLIAGYGLSVVNYLLILFNQGAAFMVFMPLAAVTLLALVQILQGKAPGYIRTTGAMFWGIMVINYGMAHACYLFIHPAFAAGPAGPAGWFLYLLILTEANDIAQALVGRSTHAGKRGHPITPTLSPHKTWEGFCGGLLATPLLALCLAPWLTTLDSVHGALLTGLCIAVAGFFGDINMSGIKRDSGVKDGSALLPGMGGLIDRIDSLTFSAPAYVYWLGWWLP